MQQMIEPNIDGATLEDWQLFILRTTFQGGGFMLVDVANIDTAGAPVIKAGSRMEINGAFYKAAADEAVTGSPASGTNYVYAVPNSSGVYFQYSAIAPAYSAVKGGWYNGNNRAVLKLSYYGGEYNSKVILYSHSLGGENMGGSVIQQKTIVSSPYGTLIKTITPASGLADRHFRLEKGTYCFEVAAGGGGGGGGGNGGPDEGNGSAGGSGAAGGNSWLASVDYLLAAFGGVGSGGGGGGQGDLGGNGGNGGNGGSPAVTIDLPDQFIGNQENRTQLASIFGGGGGGGGGGGDRGRGGGGQGGNAAAGTGGAGGVGGSSIGTGGKGGDVGQAGEDGAASAANPGGAGGAPGKGGNAAVDILGNKGIGGGGGGSIGGGGGQGSDGGGAGGGGSGINGGSGNNRNTAIGGGGSAGLGAGGAGGGDTAQAGGAASGNSGGNGGTGGYDAAGGGGGGLGRAGGKIIERVLIIDNVDFVSLAGAGGAASPGTSGGAGWVKVYKVA
jgi:hypothetical protein